MKPIKISALITVSLIFMVIGSTLYISYKDYFYSSNDKLALITKPYLIERLEYIDSFIIPDISTIDEFDTFLDYQPTAAILNIQSIADTITKESNDSFNPDINHSLPLLAHWNSGDIGFNEGMTPDYVISLIEEGKHILPSWKLEPYWTTQLPQDYYKASILRAKELNLPLTFIIDPLENTFLDDSYYFSRASDTNPNVVDKNLSILPKISPFADNELWSDIAKNHAQNDILQLIQGWYPNPPLIMFVDNKNTNKLSWNELNISKRYIDRYGNSQNDTFKRTLIGAQWIEKYRILHEDFKNFLSDTWKANTKFVSYNSISLDIGSSDTWHYDSTITNHYFSAWPQTSDAVNIEYVTDGTRESLNNIIFNVNNLDFLLKEAKKSNKSYSHQLSISDNNTFATLDEYRGFAQLSLWLTRPNIIREFTNESNDKTIILPRFQAIIDSVELVHNDATLQKFWKDGKLVENNNTKIKQYINVPLIYANSSKWYLLDVNTNPVGPWTTASKIPVYAIALETGIAPNREWLVYAQSKAGELNNISVSIPNYTNVLIKSSVQGAFYSIKENQDPIGINISIFTQAQIEETEIANLDTLTSSTIPILSYTDYGQPIKTTRTEKTLIVPNQDGVTWDILQIYTPAYGSFSDIVIIDTFTNAIKTIQQEVYMNWHLATNVIAPNGKLYISVTMGSTAQLVINVYDPVTNELTMNAIALPDGMSGETHPMTLGTDGNIYIAGSAYGTGKAQLAMINPNTNEVTDFGEMGAAHENAVWGYYICSDDRYTYVSSGKVPWYLVSYDRVNKTQTTLMESELPIELYQYQHGCSTKGNSAGYYLYNNELIPTSNTVAPWSIPADITYVESMNTTPEKALLPALPEISLSKAEADNNGNAEIFVKQNGIWNSFPYTVRVQQQRLVRLITLPNGNIFGTAASYAGHFQLDPETGQHEFSGKVHLSHYTTSSYNNKLYLSGYATGRLFEYDYSKAWTQMKSLEPDELVVQEDDPSLNPRYIGNLSESSGTHKMWTSTVGQDGFVYFGGIWMRDGTGGGLSWYDPTTDIHEGIYEIFSNYQIRYITSVGKYIVISTVPIYDILLQKPTPTEGRIFIFDTELKEIVRTIDPTPEAFGPGLIIGTDDTHIFGITRSGTTKDTYETYTYRLDIETGEMIYKMKLPMQNRLVPGNNNEGGIERFILGPNGFVWGIINYKTLVKIEPSTGIMTAIGILPGDAEILTFSGNKLFSAKLNNVIQINY